MARMPALFLAGLLGACAGETLDLGGNKPGTTTGGSVPDVRPAASWPVIGQRNARSLQSRGAHLYWMVSTDGGSEIRRCEKSDCANTQVTTARFSGHVMGFEIRGDTIYGATTGSIFSCPIDDPASVKTIVANVQPRAVAFDEANVYWSQWDGDPNLYACSLDCPERSGFVALAGASPVEIAVDQSQVYFGVHPNLPGALTSVMAAPKGHLAAATIFAADQVHVAGLSVQGGYVYWTSSFAMGMVVRCPVTGCPRETPEVLAADQYFPHFVQADDHFLSWMNGPKGPNKTASGQRPVQVLGCDLQDCASTIQRLDDGLGGGFAARANATNGGSQTALPARELAIDETAIYWLGDIHEAPVVAGASATVEASVRRTARPVK